MSWYNQKECCWQVENNLNVRYGHFLNREFNYDRNSNSSTNKNVRGWFHQNYGYSDMIVRDVLFKDYNHFMGMDEDMYCQIRDRHYNILLMQHLRYHKPELELFFL
jgi:hypothetical protein